MGGGSRGVGRSGRGRLGDLGTNGSVGPRSGWKVGDGTGWCPSVSGSLGMRLDALVRAPDAPNPPLSICRALKSHAGSIRNGKPSPQSRRSGPAGPSVLDTSLAKRMRAETHSQCAIFCVSLYVVHTSTLADSILVSISLL